MSMDVHSDFAVPGHSRQRGWSPGQASSVVLTGSSPTLARAALTLNDHSFEWHVGGAAIDVGAGSGIASAIVDATMGAPDTSATASVRERNIPVDQTHTSVIVDERWVVKIVGFWGAADRSAAILERIMRHEATVSPEFVGALQWDHPERGITTVALVTEYIPESEDGWTWATQDTLAYLAAASKDADAPVPDWPGQLGILTAHMHTALLVDEDDVPGHDPRTGDQAQAREAYDRLFGIIDAADIQETHPAFADEAFVHRVRARKRAFKTALASIPAESHSPLIIPHGDYHVGQLLRTGDGRYLVLDFDGDPQWDAARRLRPDGAARDVAHMLVSIDLVASVVQRRLGHADERAWEWATSAQQQFLDAYRAVAPEGLLDTAPLKGLVAEQLLHELLYAHRFLPRWRYAPDGVIARRYPIEVDLLTGDAAEEHLYFPHPLSAYTVTEYPWNPPASPTT